MVKNRDLLAIGHSAHDYIIRVPEFPKANFSAPITNMKTFNGGAAANVACVGAKLGLKTSLVSAVGGDFKRTEYYEHMQNLGIDTDSLIIVPGEETPTAFVLTDENDDQISYFYWGAAKEFAQSKVPVKSIENTEAVHLATGDPEFNWKCSQEAKNQDLLVSFDPGQDLGMYDTKKLVDVIKNTTILFGNHHEIERILDALEVDLLALRQMGPKIIVKTCGAKGCEIYSNEDKIIIDAIPTEAIDPTGAGDSYRAGFLSRFLNGESLEESAKFASSVSSFIIQHQGCQTNMPTFDEAFERMSEFY
ncbi:MAG: carbohydrate kinase family protein [Methanobrevibacter sp.]|uniref:carbohydrate kinase family protein n=1 Tax=Methanobrevibacter sp. TaxID=66852 RepID=UPI0025E37E52|nr:carbohydrate kinase family protein [Methanobrevibacter sp.]MBQ8016877.1 carbohydrate kinase family protein [Methanobrevibacter sp.]